MREKLIGDKLEIQSGSKDQYYEHEYNASLGNKLTIKNSDVARGLVFRLAVQDSIRRKLGVIKAAEIPFSTLFNTKMRDLLELEKYLKLTITKCFSNCPEAVWSRRFVMPAVEVDIR